MRIDKSKGDRYTSELQKESQQATRELLSRAIKVATRAAAVDTGAIEGLYNVDRGFTFTVAMETTLWQEEVDKKGAKFKRMFEAQLQTYDLVLDFSTKKVPIAEAWIRRVAQTCAISMSQRSH